ncbi:hypothetical protein CC79DRAFT_1088692 [Sarocladium strictum]
MCSNGRCCPTGQNCVPGGCCPSGNSQCGSGGCYNPGAGQACCGGVGRSCPSGYDCVANGCCRRGTKPCGNGCYDPNTQICCSGGGSCPKSAECVSGGCCPKGMKSCGSGKCYDPKTQVCCGETGTCRKSETCVEGGCCPKGQSKCGSTKCYDKKTQTCCEGGICSDKRRAPGACSLDSVCPIDKTCVGNNRCCPKGMKLCGEIGCYDPKTQTCCDDGQGNACPKTHDCMKDGGCCPKGQIKCGKDKCYDPKTTNCCRDSSSTTFWGCLSGYQCCVASQGCFDANTQRCCSDPTGPCDINGACCNGKCCAAGEMCNRLKKCVKKQGPTSSKTKSCTTPTATRPAPSSMETIPFIYDPKRSIRNSADPGSDKTFDVSNQAVLMNMCRGMKKLNGGKATQTMKLTYAGKGENNCWQKRNRKIMCPKKKGKNFCANAIGEYVDQFFPDGAPSWAKKAIQEAGDMSCDEFPFANTLQGGDLVNGVVTCLPSDDNSFQGGSMGKYFKKIAGHQAIEAGEDYVIEIQGWDCDKDIPKRRRDYLEVDLDLDRFTLNIFENSPGDLVFAKHGKRDSFQGPVPRYGGE